MFPMLHPLTGHLQKFELITNILIQVMFLFLWSSNDYKALLVLQVKAERIQREQISEKIKELFTTNTFLSFLQIKFREFKQKIKSLYKLMTDGQSVVKTVLFQMIFVDESSSMVPIWLFQNEQNQTKLLTDRSEKEYLF